MSNSAKKREKVQRKAAAKALEAMRTEQTNKEISKAKLEEDILLPPAIDSDNESDKFSAFDTPYSESGQFCANYRPIFDRISGPTDIRYTPTSKLLIFFF